jgi:hypothetical protein
MRQAEDHDSVCGMMVDPSEAAACIEHHSHLLQLAAQSVCNSMSLLEALSESAKT